MVKIVGDERCVEGQGVRCNSNVKIFDADSSSLQIGLCPPKFLTDFVRPGSPI